MKRTTRVFGTLFVCLALAIPAGAAEKGWHLRVFAAGFDPDLDVIVPAENPDEVRVRADSDLGFGASLEYQFSSLIGVELGYMQASPAIELIAEDVPGFGDIILSDSMSTTAVTLDLDLHLTPNSQYFDFFLGAGIASMNYGNLDYVEPDGDSLTLSVGNDLGYSVKAGLEIAFGANSAWAAVGGLRYIWTDLEVDQPEDPTSDTATFDFNTFSFTVGVAYRF